MDFRDIKEFFKDSLKYIIMIIVILFLVICVVSFHQVMGPSMNKTLSEGDVVLVNKFIYKFRKITRNEIVVLKHDEKLLIKEKMIEKEIQRLQHTTIGGKKEVQKLLEQYGSTLLQSGSTLADLLKRPELSYDILAPIDEDRQNLPEDVCEQVNISLKYEGYITRQQKQVAQYQKLENRKIPEDIDYNDVKAKIIDLPGIYSLSPYGEYEHIAFSNGV